MKQSRPRFELRHFVRSNFPRARREAHDAHAYRGDNLGYLDSLQDSSDETRKVLALMGIQCAVDNHAF